MCEIKNNNILKVKLIKSNRLCKGHSVQFSSVTQSCPILYDPMNCSMPGLPIHHQLPEFIQTHVHLVGDAIQPSHPLLPLLLLPPVFPSIKVFSSESVLRIRWPKREKAEREGQVLLNPMPAWPLCAHAPRRHTETLKRNKYWSRGERKAPEWIGIFAGAMFFRRWSGKLI